MKPVIHDAALACERALKLRKHDQRPVMIRYQDLDLVVSHLRKLAETVAVSKRLRVGLCDIVDGLGVKTADDLAASAKIPLPKAKEILTMVGKR